MVESNLCRARDLIFRYGWNATAFQIINPGIDLWFRDDAVIGYVARSRRRIVAGAPVCSEDRLPELIQEFEAESASQGKRVCYFGAAGRLQSLLQDKPGYSTVVLGGQPVWDPTGWGDIIGRFASLRAQLHRARNKGVTVEEWNPHRARDDSDLRRVLSEWLETRGLPPLHFLVEPETLRLLEGRRIFVASRHGRVVGFVVVSPIPTRNGWLTEQFVRGRGAPNGTVELMLDFAMRSLAASGARYVTMGLVPLSHLDSSGVRNPSWLRFILGWVRAHGRRFYNFGGLEAFKAKFRPHEWEPIFAISNEERFSFRTLYAIAGAFTKTSPLTAVTRGLSKAIRQELRWLFSSKSGYEPGRSRAPR